MINKKVIRLAVSIFILGVLLIPMVSQASEKLQIKIWVDKDQFFVREPIPVNYEIKNISDSTVFLSFGMIAEDFVIKDEQGQDYSTHRRGSFSGGGNSLSPGETHQNGGDIGGLYEIKSVGEYTCYIYTQPSAVFNFGWTKSNTIKFKVIEPQGDEKKALNMLLEAEKLAWCKDKDPKKWDLAFKKYQELVDTYPKSVYAPLSLSSARGIYRYSKNLEERKKVIPISKRLIEEYPNSIYFMSAFTSLVEAYEVLKDKAGAIEVMNELIKKHPNTKILEEAEKRLQRIEEWKF
jgi:tetratricopeptide (TPR) repeat protein